MEIKNKKEKNQNHIENLIHVNQFNMRGKMC